MSRRRSFRSSRPSTSAASTRSRARRCPISPLLRATRNNAEIQRHDDGRCRRRPRPSRKELIDKLDADKIPNIAQGLQALLFDDGYGVGFAMSSAGLFINPQVTEAARQLRADLRAASSEAILLNTPQNTQSVYLLIVGDRVDDRQAAEGSAIPDRAGLGQAGRVQAQRPQHLRQRGDGACRWRRARPTSAASSIRRRSIPTRSRARRSTWRSRRKAPSPASTA